MTEKNLQNLPPAYDAKSVEAEIYSQWERGGYFLPKRPKRNAEKRSAANQKSFVIALPPPNATGTLHLGHAMMLAVEDLLVRYHRLRGKETLWVPGTDHAAIATQNVVEKQIWQAEKKTRHDLGREELLRRIEQFVAASRDTIRSQMRRMGASLDWSRERYTLDEDLSRCVRLVFKMMYDDGLIYRGDRIVNWCPRCQTTLADDEVEYREEWAPFYYFKYGPVVIGTARPETKFLDKTIVVHPDDDRYRDIVGKTFQVQWIEDRPLTSNVIADPVMDPKFGSGAMTITPAHSFDDFDLALRHHLPIVPIIDEQGNFTDAVTPEFRGQNARASRQKIVEILRRKGLVDHIDENYIHNLPICYRCETPVEPLVSKQWFVAVNKPVERLGGKTLRQRAREVVALGEIAIVPDRFIKTYLHWMDNLRDWCISRQIWFGHRIPAWYDMADSKNKNGVIFFERPIEFSVNIDEIVSLCRGQGGFSSDDNETEIYFATFAVLGNLVNRGHITWDMVRAHGIKALNTEACTPVVSAEDNYSESYIQDPDTLDTWFSSGLWTFSTLLKQDIKAETLEEWRAESPDLKRYHPTSVLETGYDILFFWVARMVLMTTYALGEAPFRTVYLHGLVRDKDGRKMSKSLGNVIDPVDMIAKYGADAVRLSLIIGTTPGNDVRLYEEKIAGYRNFVNKLWNISRYILSSTAPTDAPPEPQTLADRWILGEFEKLKRVVADHIEAYRFSAAGEALYEFTWSKLADWYVEAAKFEKNKDAMLRNILSELLVLWHPFAPFVSEHIWMLAHKSLKEPLIINPWPKSKKIKADKIQKEFETIQSIVSAIRDLRQKNNLNRANVEIVSSKFAKLIKKEQTIIEALSRSKLSLVKRPTLTNMDKRSLPSISIFIKKEAGHGEGRKTGTERQKLQNYIASLETRLDNQKFLAGAPAVVVAKEKERLREAREKLRHL